MPLHGDSDETGMSGLGHGEKMVIIIFSNDQSWLGMVSNGY